MDIHRNNIEAWLLDLYEGRLSGAEEAAVKAFLEKNPGCAEIPDAGIRWQLEGDPVPFPGKEGLVKRLPNQDSPVARTDFDMLSIARLEGDLTGGQEADFDRLLEEDPELMREFLQWQRCRLSPDTLSYGGKAGLLKKVPANKQLWWISMAAAAAGLMLLITLFRSTPEPVEPLAAVPVEIPPAPKLAGPVPEAEPESLEGREESIPTPVVRATKHFPAMPEATGEVEVPVPVLQEQEAIAVRLTLTSLKVNSEQLAMVRPMEDYPRDRIAALDLPAGHPRTRTVDWNRISEGSLKLASAGMKQINRMTGSNLDLDVSRGEEGEVSGISFRSNLFTLNAPVGKTD